MIAGKQSSGGQIIQLLRADWPVLGTVRSLDFILLAHGFNVSSLHALGAEVIPHFGVTEKNQRDDAQRQVDHVAVDDVNDLHDGDGPSGGEGGAGLLPNIWLPFMMAMTPRTRE